MHLKYTTKKKEEDKKHLYYLMAKKKINVKPAVLGPLRTFA